MITRVFGKKIENFMMLFITGNRLRAAMVKQKLFTQTSLQ